jgi:membrane protease YdiL (CAAX protease family)
MATQSGSSTLTQIQTSERQNFLRMLAGFIAIYVVFEGSARLMPALGITRPLTFFVVALAVIATAFTIEMALFNQSFAQAAARLGLGRPSARVVAVTALFGGLMLACYPLISTITGAKFTLPSNAGWMLLGIAAMNGIAEEMMMRGYLFRHLRATRTFGWAIVWVMVLHAAMHIVIVLEAGLLVGGAAVITALASGVPMAYVFERGRNTLWGSALLHFVADTVIVLTLGSDFSQPATQMATALWLLVVIVFSYLMLLLRKVLFAPSDK